MDREQCIDDLVKRILSGEDSLMHDLWREPDYLCGWYCRKLLKQLPEAFNLEFEDLYHCGYIALCNALQHCSPDADEKFTSYYLLYLTGTIYQENGLLKGGRSEDGQRRFDPVISRATLRLDAPVDDEQETPEPLYNFLSNEHLALPTTDTIEQIYEQVYQLQLHEVLEHLIDGLPELQQYVIRQKYYEGRDCARIAENLGIIRGRVYALEDRALLQLRKDGKTVGLGQFLNDEINYYSGTGISQFRQSGFSSTERIALKRMDLEARFAGLCETTQI